MNAETNFSPALRAEFVMFCNAVSAITSIAENLIFTVSTALDNGDILHLLAAVLTDSSPFAAPSKLRLCFNLSIDDKLV